MKLIVCMKYRIANSKKLKTKKDRKTLVKVRAVGSEKILCFFVTVVKFCFVVIISDTAKNCLFYINSFVFCHSISFSHLFEKVHN